MGNIDWNSILSLDPEKIRQDHDLVDKLSSDLSGSEIDLDAPEAGDPNNVRKFFQVMREVLLFKEEQVYVGEDEVARLVQENDMLKDEMQQLKKFSGTGERSLLAEISRLDDRNHAFEKELDEMSNKYAALAKQNDDLVKQQQTSQGTIAGLKREVERIRNDAKDLHRQLEAQRDRLTIRKDRETFDESKKLTEEVNSYLAEIDVLERENKELQVKLVNIQKEVESAASEMDIIATDYNHLKQVLEDTDRMLDDVRRERDVLKGQCEDLQVQLQAKDESDDNLAFALNQKMEEWKSLLTAKDKEILDRDTLISELQRRLQANQMDTDKATVADLMNVVKERDSKIKELKGKLDQATAEMKIVTDKVEEIKKKSRDDFPSLRHQAKIQELSKSLKQEQVSTLKERGRVERAEEDAAEKDKVISELMSRMMQYERGQYGLPEAVQEIKECRGQLRIRDKELEQITTQLNRLQIQADDLESENEELRERLGLDPKAGLDANLLRQKHQVKLEQANALNRQLTKEVERLEEERLTLKRQLRKQAMHRGERAVELGLTAEDLALVEEVATASGAYGSQVGVSDRLLKEHAQLKKNQDMYRDQAILYKREFEQNQEKLKKITQLKERIDEENKHLRDGLNELLEAMKSQNSVVGQEIRVPALEKLLALLEARGTGGDVDISLSFKNQIQRLRGQNEELKSELRIAREELKTATVNDVNKDRIIENQAKELESLREAGLGVIKINPLQLPEGIPPSSVDIIASLNEFIIQILQDMSNKEELMGTMERELEGSRRKLLVLNHQLRILYKEHVDGIEEAKKQVKQLKEEQEKMQTQKEQDAVRIKEFENLLSTLKQSPDHVQSRMADLVRKVTTLKVNERSLSRRYTILLEVESNLREENAKLQKEQGEMETAVKKRLGFLTRYRDFASYKLTALQKALDESVPEADLALANKQYNELASKYRDLLQQENMALARSARVDELEFEVQRHQKVEDELRTQLHQTTERAFALEQSLQQLVAQGNGAKQDVDALVNDESVLTMARQLATLEMKELNERQKAEHAVRRYEQLRSTVNELESRNKELEEKFSFITQQNLEGQRVERELREELANALPSSLGRQLKARVEQLESSEASLKLEVDRLKEVADVATTQVKTITRKQQSLEKELTAVRRQLYDLQMETDEKTLIAKLYQHIMALQGSEATAVYKLEQVEGKIKLYELQILQLEQKVDDKDQLLSQTRNDGRLKARFLKRTIQDLRRQFSGALPLVKQEKFSQTLRVLEQSKLNVQQEFRKIREQSYGVQDRLAELKLKNDSLVELVATLKDRKGAEKVVEWHTRISDVRLKDLKLHRQMERLQGDIKHQEEAIHQREQTIGLLEEQLVLQAKEFEERQLTWEQHEVELERMILRHEKQQEDLIDAAQRFEQATGSVVDKSLPVANQLEHAIRKLKEHIKTIIITKAESNKMSEELREVRERAHILETESTKKDRVINELKLRLPFSERTVALYEGSVSSVKEKEDKDKKQKSEIALQVAQTTVDSLKLILQKKEETLLKYQNMLKAAREELRAQDEAYRHELKVMQERLHLEISENVRKMKQTHLKYVNEAGPGVKPLEEVTRVVKLEEAVTEQDNAMAALTAKYSSALEDTKKARVAGEKRVAKLRDEMKAMEERHAEVQAQLQKEIENREQEIRGLREEIKSLSEDLQEAKEANAKAPSKTMRNLVEKLRNQLALKEKQQKTLSQALLHLRADMVSNAESNLQTEASRVGEEMNVQRVVEARTADLEDEVQKLKSKLRRLQQDAKEKSASESELQSKVNILERDNAKKEDALRKVALELKRQEELEDEVTELRSRNKLLEKCKTEAENLKKQLLVMQSEVVAPVLEDAATTEAVPPEDFTENDAGKDRIETKKDSADEVQRWSENKQWQQRTEKLKARLKERSEELQKARNESQMLRNIISRQGKDKKPGISAQSMPEKVQSAPALPPDTIQDLQELKREVFELRSENDELRATIARRDEEIKSLRYREIEQVERSRQSFEVPERDTDGHTRPMSASALSDGNVRKELLEMRKENMELNFEIEKATREVPRLKGRVQDLEEYVEVLKADLEACRKKERTRKAMPGSVPGQSVEDMERVIAAMRRVIERLHKENENLQKQAEKNAAPGLTRQNKQLRQEIHLLKSKATSRSDQTASMAKGTGKLIQDNEVLRKELAGEKEKNEKLKENIKKIQQELNDNLPSNERGTDKSLRDSQGGKETLSNPARVVQRYEERIRALQAESERKSQLLQELKDFLKVAAEKEQTLMGENERLKKLLADIETEQLDFETTGDLDRTVKQAKLRIKRLEAEKGELLHDLEVLRGLVGASRPNMDEKERHDGIPESFDSELRNHIEVLEGNITDLKKENERLRDELSGFDPTFFEELEDLKYNYKKSVERNVLYERQLNQLAKQFGVHVNIPADDHF